MISNRSLDIFQISAWIFGRLLTDFTTSSFSENEDIMDKTISLLVEDDKNMREALSEILESAGYLVQPLDGTEALAQANINLLICETDLVMPDKTGVELSS